MMPSQSCTRVRLAGGKLWPQGVSNTGPLWKLFPYDVFDGALTNNYVTHRKGAFPAYHLLMLGEGKIFWYYTILRDCHRSTCSRFC